MQNIEICSRDYGQAGYKGITRSEIQVSPHCREAVSGTIVFRSAGMKNWRAV